jgi:hypothetical protein
MRYLSRSNGFIASVATLAVGSLLIATDVSAQTNSPPQISATPMTSVTIGSWYYTHPTASDPDGDKLRFSIANKPSWAYFNTGTGTLQAKPTKPGTWNNIIISVSDGWQKVSLPPFSITVYAKNTAPVISGSPTTTATVSQAYSFQPSASDANGDALGFSIQNKPTWASFSTSTGKLSGTPTAAGTYSNIVIAVSDGKVSASLPAFAIAVSGATANRAPTISGTPLTAVNANSAYSFRPTAADADGDTLTFAVANKPAWAAFSTTTGQLSGTPAAGDVGGYSNIVISVSDGKTSAALPAFAIAVNQVSLGSASVSWTPPTQNTDGTSLTNLAGYRIVYGTSASALTQTVQIANPGMSTYVIDGLAPATYYFAVKAYTSTGTESANSNVASKVVQ